jgi:hypothetical protein
MNYNDYNTQKLRGLKRKLELIKSRGGKCELCGYDRNIAVLEFHHINPDEKEFQLDMRHLSNTSLERLKEEADKCQLLCANSHREVHNPHLGMDLKTAIVFVTEAYESGMEKARSLITNEHNEEDY